MILIEDSALNRYSVLLKEFDGGDRVFNGCIELFSTVRSSGVSTDKQLNKKEMLNNSEDKCVPIKSSDDVKSLLINFISVMNQCYTDYDFSEFGIEHFKLVDSFVDAYNTVNYQMAFIVDRCIPGFLKDLWETIHNTVNLNEVRIYSCVGPFADEDEISSFHLFFYEKAVNKMVFFSCITKCKYSLHHDNIQVDSEEDADSEELSDDDERNGFSGNSSLNSEGSVREDPFLSNSAKSS